MHNMTTVLIVDDDKFLHKVLERILSIGGHEVVGHAYNGEEAIELYIKMNPHPGIILMDHRMPVMKGTIATRELLKINPEAKIFFISADDAIKDEAIEAGAIGFLTKPIRSKDLFEILKDYE
ncbi:MAG: response regulator [Candidatus Lokiarchaeota archaeon]|nr:response regulator [Candidatus Lokiarchaeota archaeon]